MELERKSKSETNSADTLVLGKDNQRVTDRFFSFCPLSHQVKSTGKIFFWEDFSSKQNFFLAMKCKNDYLFLLAQIFVTTFFAAAACLLNRITGDAIFDLFFGQQALSSNISI